MQTTSSHECGGEFDSVSCLAPRQALKGDGLWEIPALHRSVPRLENLSNFAHWFLHPREVLKLERKYRLAKEEKIYEKHSNDSHEVRRTDTRNCSCGRGQRRHGLERNRFYHDRQERRKGAGRRRSLVLL